MKANMVNVLARRMALYEVVRSLRKGKTCLYLVKFIFFGTCRNFWKQTI